MWQLSGSHSRAPLILTAEQRPVQAEGLRQVLDVSDPLVHGSGEVVGVVQAAQDDAGEVDRLCEIAHQGALESNHIPPEGKLKKKEKRPVLARENNRHIHLEINREWSEF